MLLQNNSSFSKRIISFFLLIRFPKNRQKLYILLLQTTGATDWEFFSVDDDFFLVVANAFNFGPHADEKTERYR